MQRVLMNKQFFVSLVLLCVTSSLVGMQEEVADASMVEASTDLVCESDVEALCKAAVNGNLETMRALIAKGVDISGYNRNGAHALWCAAYNGEISAIDLLMQSGAQVDQKRENSGYATAVQAAVAGRHYEALERLVKVYNANKSTAPDEMTLLEAACFQRQPEMVDFLLGECGFNANTSAALLWASRGITPVMLASMIFSSVEVPLSADTAKIIDLLVSHGADINKKDYVGMTALIMRPITVMK